MAESSQVPCHGKPGWLPPAACAFQTNLNLIPFRPNASWLNRAGKLCQLTEAICSSTKKSVGPKVFNLKRMAEQDSRADWHGEPLWVQVMLGLA
jgi:hypothetical protein